MEKTQLQLEMSQKQMFYHVFFPRVGNSYSSASLKASDKSVKAFKLIYGADMSCSIPFIFLPYLRSKDEMSDKCVLYFHGNGEDLGRCFGLLDMTRQQLGVNVVGVEYPGYGCSKRGNELPVDPDGSEAKLTGLLLYELFAEVLKFGHPNTYLFGRSIGTGPASWVAAECPQTANLILWSPFSSITAAAEDWKVAKRVAPEHHSNLFDNVASVGKTQARLLLIHGEQDEVFRIKHARALAEAYDGTHERKALFSKQEMTHNMFDYGEQVLAPVAEFIGAANGHRSYTEFIQAIEDGSVNGKSPFKSISVVEW